ncbi:MAG: TRAP transporter small permease subunit [Rhodocyclales bacterium]|nr:TRAP transporter small permease subunit [Rhodocyclales bacterium]
MLASVDALMGLVIRAVSILVLPLAVLLFLQWPLREMVQAYSRESNDLAQVLFALYVSIAITAATRTDGHLAADTLARRFRAVTRHRLKRLAAMVILLPWSGFVLWVAWPTVWQSLRGLEAFPDTYNPGFFVVRTAVALLAVAVLVQGLIDVCRRSPGADP